RQATLAGAFQRTPNRFKHRMPQPQKLPTAAWINPPIMEKNAAKKSRDLDSHQFNKVFQIH
ncbi:hypothetical protein KVP70_30415, partial [Duganella sp. HSC-15S17]|nr:hypothetical protein [Duganella violaceicalia]